MTLMTIGSSRGTNAFGHLAKPLGGREAVGKRL